MVNEQQIYLFGWIQPGQTGGQLYGDNSPYEVSEWFYPCFLVDLNICKTL